MKFFTSSAIAAAILAMTSAASAEVLNYNFKMNITSISDGYGVFDELNEGGEINVSVQFDTAGDWDGIAVINVAELGYEAAGTWTSSWSDVQYNSSNASWDAYSGIISGNLIVNDVEIHSGSVHQEVYLDFGITESGQMGLLTGSMNIGVYNGSSAYLTARYVPSSPTSVPELDPNSGMAALAIVGGGAAVAYSRRRRDEAAIYG
jgi:hypothetical protein